MFHVDIMPITTCFPYVFTHFPTFSGTNLLTRCPVPVPCFLLFFVSEKLLRKFLGIGPHESRKSYFPRKHPEVRRRVEDGHQGGHTMSRRPPGRAWTRCGVPGGPPASLFCLFIPFLGKTLKARTSIHKKFRSRRHHQP